MAETKKVKVEETAATTSAVTEIKKDVEKLMKAAEKKPKKPREKVREIEEIRNLPFSKLSDKEKEKLIKTLKEENNLVNNKCESFKRNAETAFAQTRELENKYDAMEKFYIGQLQYINNQLNAFHAAINQALKGGLQ